VIELHELDELASVYGVLPNDPQLPQLYPNPASSQTWALREIYPWNGPASQGIYPLEYSHIPAHFHIGFSTNLTDTAGIYDLLLNTHNILSTDTCVPGVASQSCTVSNGIGVRACINNQLLDQCAAISCDGGYRLDIYTSSCQPCGVGQWRNEMDDIQTSCNTCSMISNITLADGVNCHGRFTSQVVTMDACPYTYVCDGGEVASNNRRNLYIAIGILVPVSVIAIIIACYFQRKASTSATAVNDYSRMGH
jgi:hypothetical protein